MELRELRIGCLDKYILVRIYSFGKDNYILYCIHRSKNKS